MEYWANILAFSHHWPPCLYWYLDRSEKKEESKH